MDQLELMKARHSVRRFTDRALDGDAADALREEIDLCNKESGMNFQLVTDEPEAFGAGRTSYGQIRGCRNYIAVVGPKGMDAEAGYYGERIVLKAQELGIGSCWVALTYRKRKARIIEGPGEKRYLVIALGYGETPGVPHRSKTPEEVSDYRDGDPEWYRAGLEAALLAPTAVNQQKFRFERDGEKVSVRVDGFGFYTGLDLGIVRYHFEIGSGRGRDVWKDPSF